ncbi:ABC transporter substrate-binding protein [Murimonas intestini]|uniref:ABC transporter substrate-binding protein n=1 Tax=Murimonas intestini TaxID=1337051 RepID=UPI0011DC91B0|nr:extracellular solute-binding protein [Murimonas intestini]
MKQKKMNRALGICMAAVLAGGALGCGNSATAAGGSDTAKKQITEKEITKQADSSVDISGTTIRFASSSLKDEATQAVWDQILETYKEKSGVTVEMENFENAEFRTWITTQHAANNAPEVFDLNYSWAWEDYNKGYLIDFNDYLDTTNPYNGDKVLKDTMSDILLQQAVNPDNGTMPGIPGRVLGVKIIYNKTMLNDAGVTELPKTYTEFIDACKKLQDKGYVPFGFANAKVNDAHMNWWLHNFVSQMDAELRAEMDMNGDGFVAKNELVAATDKGLIDFTKSPFKDGIEILKDFSTYWNSDFNSTDQTGAVDLWLSGKVAMTTVGSFQANLLTELEGLDYEYGLMQLPVLTTDDYPQVTGKSLNNGGRLVDVYAVTKVDDPVKQAAAVDFVKYLLSPEVLNVLMDEFLVIPPLKDMELSEKLAGWLTTDTEDFLHANYFGYATSKEFTDFQVLSSQVYLTDDMDLEEYTSELNTEWQSMCENAKIENDWSEENGYGTK